MHAEPARDAEMKNVHGSREECPLFTSRHAHHSSAWTISGFSVPKLCIACTIERLENRGELSVHLKKVLGEFRGLLGASGGSSNSSSLLDTLSSDRRVLEHLCNLLFGLLMSQDVSVTQSSLEVLITLLSQLSSQDIARKLMQRTVQTVMTAHNFSSSLPHITFLGQLLHSMTSLCSDVAHSYAGFLEFLVGGMSYPSETVKTAVVYVLVQVCSKAAHNSLPIPLVQNMCRHISTNLATAKSQELTINLLGLVRNILKDGTYTQCLLQADQLNSEAKGSTFASAFKRVLLSRDEMLQLSGVQCVAEVLAQHAQYGHLLLKADIAEFMFEALSSKNEMLMNSLFSCLNSLASIDEFYSKCHVIYGIEPVITGLHTTMRLRNYSAAQLGFSLLSKILTRQPSSMPLFSSPETLQKLLDVMNTALQVQSSAVVLQASNALSSLLNVSHIPSGFPLNAFLPLLALLLHHVEPLTTPPDATTMQIDATSKRTLCEVLLVAERMSKLCLVSLKGQEGGLVLQDSELEFLFKMFDESLLPAILLNLDQFEQSEPFTSLFSVATCQFTLCGDHNLAYAFAKKLEFSPFISLTLLEVSAGFIQLSFELKSKFCMTPSYQALCSTINLFLEQLCVHLERDGQSATYIREILHSALPHMNCGAGSCLQFLSQRVGGFAMGKVQKEGNSLQALQSGTLTLLYFALTHGDSLVPPGTLLQTLNSFLSLNPDVHMLPFTSLTHLTVLYAMSSEAPQNILTQQYHGIHHLSNVGDAVQILVRGLQRVPNPSSLFVPNKAMLEWAFRQQGLASGAARSWLVQWLKLLREDGSVSEEQRTHLTIQLLEVLQNSTTALDSLLNLLTGENVNSGDIEAILSGFEHLASQAAQTDHPHSAISNIGKSIFGSLQKALLVQRIEPLSSAAVAVILKALLKLQVQCGQTTDLKLIYQIANAVTRADSVVDEASSSQAAMLGMDFLHTALKQDFGTQVAALLLNNVSFVQTVSSFIPKSVSPEDHSLLSASALHLIAELIDHQCLSNINVSHSGTVLDVHSVTATLLSPLAPVEVAGLHFWQVVFSRGGQTGCFVLQDERKSQQSTTNPTATQHIRVLLFLVQNCLVKSTNSIRESASACYTELLKYASTKDPNLSSILAGQSWSGTLFGYLTDMHHSCSLPLCYIPCIAAILNLTSDKALVSHLPMKNVAQILYKTFMNCTAVSEDSSQAFLTCFREFQRLDKSVLDTKQWANVQEHSNNKGLV